MATRLDHNSDMPICIYMHIYVYIHIFERSSTTRIVVERVNQEKRFVEFAGYITLAGNHQ